MSEDVKKKTVSDMHPAAKLFTWTQSPLLKKYGIWVIAAASVITAAMMILYPNKHPAPWETGPFALVAFGVIGFAAYLIFVLAAGPLRSALGRPENFYGEDSSDDV